LHVQRDELASLPIAVVDLSDPTGRSRYDELVQLVASMLGLHRKLAVPSAPHDRDLTQRHIAITDRQIDRLVYELYGLTEDEIAIVESFDPSPT